MIDELPPDARALRAAGRDRMGPDAATVARLRSRVEAAVILAASATAVSSATPASAATASTTAVSATASVAAKSLAVKLVVLATVGTSTYVARDAVMRGAVSSDLVTQATGAPAAAEMPEPVAPPLAPAAPKIQPELAVVPATVEAPAPAANKRKAPARRSEPVPAPPALTPEPAHATLAREIELVDRASLAVHGGDLVAALAALRTYDAETAGAGQLAQDAAALHIEVLCRTHDAAATGELAAFERRWPRSPQRSHLTTVCTEVTK